VGRLARIAAVALLIVGALSVLGRPVASSPAPPEASSTDDPGLPRLVECPPEPLAVAAAAPDAVGPADQLPNFQGPPGAPRVVVLGDSITAVSEADIRARLQTTYLTSVSAVCGYTSAQIAGNALRYAPTDADIVIVNAGTNDYPTIDVGATLDNIDAIRSHFPDACFVVASLNQHTYIPALNAFAARFNFFLAFSGRYPHILDFNRYVELHPDQFYDTVHPILGEGTQGYAGLVRDSADRCLTAITPFGSLDSVVGVPSGLRVRGWAIDPDTVAPVKVHVYVDGAFYGEYPADQPRPDVGAAHPGFGDLHGFDQSLLAVPGRHRVDVWAINVGAGTNPRLGSEDVEVIGGNPIGSLDWVRAGPGQLTVGGWSFDPDDPAPARVHVYVDGAFGGEFVADRPRPDVGAVYPGYGDDRGFEATVPAAAGTRSVCVFAINTLSGTTNPVIGCRTVRIGGNPIGAVETAVGGTGQLRVVGWALDPDTAAPIDVHVYVDGTFATAATADTTRPGLGAFFPGYGDDHGYDLVVPAPPGTRTVAVFAINTGSGTTNPYLGARTVTVT
jgi:hypothetical protein